MDGVTLQKEFRRGDASADTLQEVVDEVSRRAELTRQRRCTGGASRRA